MSSIETNLTAIQKARVVDTARSRGYNLLLGAGASLGAHNKRGPLPNAEKLIDLLAEQFPDKYISKDASLPRNYQRALLESTGDEVWEFLRKVFHQANHHQWYKDMTILPWRRVWTLNVDDTFERGYRELKPESHPELEIKSWDEDYVDNLSKLAVVHLHGHVMDSSSRKLVFSFAEYIKAAQSRPVWGQVVESLFATQPFVVVGARLLDDPDMEAVVMNRASVSAAPSFIVDPYISDGNVWELTRQGLNVAKMPAETFFAQWARMCEFENINPSDYYEDAAARLPQLKRLRSDLVPPPPRAHDFFAGDVPKWFDAVNGNIARLSWTQQLKTKIADWQSRGGVELFPVYGKRFTGISAGLLNVALNSAATGVRVYSFDRSSRFNSTDLLNVVRKQGASLLIIDGAAEFADDIDKTLKDGMLHGDLKFAIIAAESFQSALRFEGRLSAGYPRRITEVPNHLGRIDALAVANLMSEKARMGRYENEGVQALASLISKRDVFSAVLEVSQGRSFLTRISAEFSQLDSWEKDLVLVLGLASRAGARVTTLEAQFMLGISSERIVSSISGKESVASMVEVDESYLMLRQRDKALPAILDGLGAPEALNRLIPMVEGLKPLVTPMSVRARNNSTMLLGHLMGNKLLAAVFPNLDLNLFYSRLEPKFGTWNGKFWEQRAIFAKKQKEWPKAESYAARAVTLLDATYTRTTYGTILINRAEESIKMGSQRWKDFYRRGLSQFELAVRISDEGRVTEFAFLTSTLAFLREAAREDSGVKAETVNFVAEDWRSWYSSLRLAFGAEVELITSIRRLDELSRSYHALENYLGGQDQDLGRVGVGTDGGVVVGAVYEAVIKRKLDYGYAVSLGLGVPDGIIRYRDQKRRPEGPSYIPTFQPGDRVRVLAYKIADSGKPSVVYLSGA
ncbi:SIR2 family protein [Kocuria rosea]|uniref:P-loop NTPase n=1 Tax=Kocuria rosea TaxID=1275 RepID=UPI000D647714|nr:SIR2 family protein [Kocuria rosea]PWF88942.1 hypothetical protein DEJ37_05385 [Kocuria rosea]STX15655.1 Uncharacterised protein [Kocuria rosea]